jgi:LAO/AO transport system kinase
MTYPPFMESNELSKIAFSDLLIRVMNGERKALAKSITYCEDAPQEYDSLIPDSTLNSQVLGITGAPGVGKSTTVNALIKHLRAKSKTVAVIAVDPSSPITGGALLGDRIRLVEHFLDGGVFIRSLATRGHLGGLSISTKSVIKLAKLAGFDYVIVETVGVGQSEIEIMRHADCVVVVVAPGMGDGIQASKAGILEIGNIYLVNKSDRDGAKETARELEKSFHLSHRIANWQPVVLLGAMEKSIGVEELMASITKHRDNS